MSQFVIFHFIKLQNISDWFGISCMTTDNFCFYLQNRLFQTNQTGGQRYSDTSPFSIPWPCCHLATDFGSWFTKWKRRDEKKVLLNFIFAVGKLTIVRSQQSPFMHISEQQHMPTVSFTFNLGCGFVEGVIGADSYSWGVKFLCQNHARGKLLLKRWERESVVLFFK